jgi:hypothetical protein
MIDQSQRQYFTGQDVQGVITTVQGTLYSAGIQLQQTGPASWTGRGTAASYGMVPKVLIAALPMQGGFFLDVKVTPDFEGSGIVIFIVSWFVFFPLAIVLGVLAYQDWQRRGQQMLQSIWAPLAPRIAQPPGPQFGPSAWGGQ